MIKRHATFYVKNISPVEFCGKPVMWQMDVNGAFELPFEVEPTKGKHDYVTCEVCQKTLIKITKQLAENFSGDQLRKGFPFCCPHHSNLVKIKEFNRALFINVPEMVARKIIYTNQHIINNHTSENWYKVITDYIDWVVESFGKMPNDCGERLYLSHFLFSVTDSLKRRKELSSEKKAMLLEFLMTYRTSNKKKQTDVNILLGIYEKWLKEFPFELKSYFGNLKQQLEKQFPILREKPEINIYSGVTKVRLHTESSLIDGLVNLTKELLNKINVRAMVEQGIISDLNKHRFELESETLRIATSQITKNFSKGELRYIAALKKWLQLHKEYFKEIAPLLKAIPPQQTETKTEQDTVEIKPVLKPQAVQTIFEIIKNFFSTEQQTELKQTLETGNKASKKLLFRGNGNRLTDTFRKLIEHDFITGCQKRDLIDWIILNFSFMHQNKVKGFVFDTVEKTISRNFYSCKNPLIEIIKGQIQKVEQPRTKKYNKY